MHIIATSSGIKTADGAIVARPCLYLGMTVLAGADIATGLLYDNATAASGKAIDKVRSAATLSQHVHTTNGIECNNGLYLDISGTDAEVIVYYSLL
jgi:hypothetical protein